jgi:hypothetical protein
MHAQAKGQRTTYSMDCGVRALSLTCGCQSTPYCPHLMLPAELLLSEGFPCADGTRGSLGPPLTGRATWHLRTTSLGDGPQAALVAPDLLAQRSGSYGEVRLAYTGVRDLLTRRSGTVRVGS